MSEQTKIRSNKIDLDILDKAQLFISNLFKKGLFSNPHLYHNYGHTKEVVEKTKEILEHYFLCTNDREVLLLAAWFHDTGYLISYNDHEEESAKIARKFLKQKYYPSKQISQVTALIRSTKKDLEPQGLLQEILHDADLGGVSKDDFFDRGYALRAEWEMMGQSYFDDIGWEKSQLSFLESVHYRTEYAIKTWDPLRLINILKQKKKSKKISSRIKLKVIMKNHINHYEKLINSMSQLNKDLPEVMKSFADLHKSSTTMGVLDSKTKELIALGIAITVRCNGCISFHINDALKAKASKEEILETIGVAVLMGGGPSVMYGCEALEALNQFLKA